MLPEKRRRVRREGWGCRHAERRPAIHFIRPPRKQPMESHGCRVSRSEERRLFSSRSGFGAAGSGGGQAVTVWAWQAAQRPNATIHVIRTHQGEAAATGRVPADVGGSAEAAVMRCPRRAGARL
ncbi:uncharacterized protein A4U43_C02F16830 [Asparagus officinalis]|uniref:Uncharacterized protein n=1 Tax=Asparagus officinalis TaxID=4686 RepID=A0A5P1FLK7_ASPOF|nr:uncharacterized protein A4U43_C02F16830 [Asparagus officinalis]